jgi:translation initiation factor 3 subunit A
MFVFFPFASLFFCCRVKYLWECYRTILDVLRNNARLEVLYHQTARAAFDFCKRFGRNMEFRRLCEILRSHLVSVQRFANQTNAVDLNNADTQTLYLETRFQQLKMAAELELWQEAYRTIEDIHESMRLASRVEPAPELMKTYYEKLSQIFWASSNFLFHAYSLHKYYQLSAQEAAAGPAAAEQSSSATAPLSSAQRGNLASAVVLSSLIISGGQQTADLHDIDALTGVEHEGNIRLAQLLGFKKESPSRQRILAAVQQSGVMDEASDLSKRIFRLLETQFGPLTLYAQLKPLLEQLRGDAELSKYVQPLEQLTVIRVLQQLSTVFKSMKMAKLRTLVPDLGSVYALERLVLSAISSDLLNLRFDHRTGTLLFPESDLESPKLRDQLVDLSRHLICMAHTLDGQAASAASVVADKVKERTHVFKLIQANLLEEHENVFLRQELIEKRKQELEKLLIEKEKKEADAKLAALNARKAEEQRRLQEESLRREEERRRKEQAERDLRAKQQLAEEMKKKIDAAAAASALQGKGQLKAEKKIQALTQDLENVDKITLLRAQEEILKAQQREVERRRRETNRRIDYTVRAMRLEERALLLAKAETQKQEEREQMEADFAKYLEVDRANHEKAVSEKARLIDRMAREKNLFHEKLMARRQEAYAIEKSKQDERLAIKAEKRRIVEQRRREEEELRERERQIAEEKAAAERREMERQEEARIEAIARKEAERQEKLRAAKEAADKEIAAAQARMKREEEAEAKERERRQQQRGEPVRGAASERPGWGRPGAAGGADREPERDFRRPVGGEERRDERGFPMRREERREEGGFRREERREEGGFRREERPSEAGAGPQREERDFGNLRNRPAPQEAAPRQERDFGSMRRDDRPAAGGDVPRWGARGGDRDAPRGGFDRDAPRAGGFDRDAPRAGGFDRDAPRGGRFGDDRAGPRDGPRDGPRVGDREPPSRDAFGSRGGQDARGPGGFQGRGGESRGPERDMGAFRSSAAAGGERGGNFRASEAPRAGGDAPRDFRRRDEPAQQQQQQQAPAAQQKQADDDDGFTTVKGGARR